MPAARGHVATPTAGTGHVIRELHARRARARLAIFRFLRASPRRQGRGAGAPGQVNVAAAQAGTTIDFSRIATFPNTAAAHRLLALGARYLDRQAQARLLERLFAAYFQRGKDLGDAGASCYVRCTAL